jgi:hypothetical protein
MELKTLISGNVRNVQFVEELRTLISGNVCDVQIIHNLDDSQFAGSITHCCTWV